MARFLDLLPKEPVSTIHTLSLTSDTEDILQQLQSDAADFIGRAISESAIVRALLRHIAQQGPPAADALFILVEKELKEDARRGMKKR